MKRILYPLLALMIGSPIAADTVGYQTRSHTPAHRDAPLALHIWYPAVAGAPTQMQGKNAVFKGIPVAVDAPVMAQPHPLVLLSHGSGGNAVNIGWIAAALAKQGMVVIAPNHTNTTSGNSIPRETLKLWQRPMDMSAIIDFAAQELETDLHLDMSRIGVVGFSLGGHTALSLGGARADKTAYIQYCAAYPDLLDCGWFQGAGVDLNTIEATRFGQNNADARIKVIVAIDPAIAQAYTQASLNQMGLPVQVINLGNPSDVPLGINAVNLTHHIPNVRFETIQNASHFSFLGQCTNIGGVIIAASGEEAICSDPQGADRANIHQQLQTLISQFLLKTL